MSDTLIIKPPEAEIKASTEPGKSLASTGKLDARNGKVSANGAITHEDGFTIQNQDLPPAARIENDRRAFEAAIAKKNEMIKADFGIPVNKDDPSQGNYLSKEPVGQKKSPGKNLFKPKVNPGLTPNPTVRATTDTPLDFPHSDHPPLESGPVKPAHPLVDFFKGLVKSK